MPFLDEFAIKRSAGENPSLSIQGIWLDTCFTTDEDTVYFTRAQFEALEYDRPHHYFWTYRNYSKSQEIGAPPSKLTIAVGCGILIFIVVIFLVGLGFFQ